MENGKSKVVTIILSVAMLIIGVGGTCIFFSMNPNILKETSVKTEKEEKDEEKESKIEVLEVSDVKVNKLLDTISTAMNAHCGVNEYYTNEKVSVENLKESLVLSIVEKQIYDDKMAAGQKNVFGKGDSFTAEELDKKIDATFGKDYNYNHKSFGKCPTFEYNETTKMYTVPSEPGCGGTCGIRPVDKKIVKAIKTDKTMEIYVRAIFNNQAYENTMYYKDYNKTIPITNLVKDQYGHLDDTVITNYSEGTLYKFIFTEEDGNYVFTSSEPVNK